jgi:hypothetical protein
LETFGCTEDSAYLSASIDITNSVGLIKNSAKLHREVQNMRSRNHGDFMIDDPWPDHVQKMEDNVCHRVASPFEPASYHYWTSLSPDIGVEACRIRRGTEIFMTPDRRIGDYITGGSSILTTNLHDVILLNDSSPETACRNIIRQTFPHNPTTSWRPILEFCDRLNMILTIPELSLVIIASQVGRVALITITRPVITTTTDGTSSANMTSSSIHRKCKHQSNSTTDANANGEQSEPEPPNSDNEGSPEYQHSHEELQELLHPLTSMRVEAILPTKEEDADLKIRPNFPLLGIAASPLWRGGLERHGRRGKGKVAGGADRSRWRLMLYYTDHTVISYEISRDE